MSALPAPEGSGPGVELLERALGYTRSALITITPPHLHLPTPCAGWNLGDLLGHMEDSLDAFTEGADGTIGLRSAAPAPLGQRVETLQLKACHLLGAWTSTRSTFVDVAGHTVPVDTIARVAALEITVHGWDVARTTGHDASPPADLAEHLLSTALETALDRGDQFAAPLPVSADADAATRLLALLGRQRPRG